MSGSKNQRRKIEREEARAWSYQEYARKKAAGGRMQRIMQAKALLYGEIVQYLAKRIPRWLLVFAARYLPPPKVTMLMHVVVQVIPQRLFRWFVEFAMAPAWLATVLVWPYDIIVCVPAYMFFTPMMALKKLIMRCGHRYSIRVDEESETMVLTIRNFWLWRVYTKSIKV